MATRTVLTTTSLARAGTDAIAVRRKWTRHRCQVAPCIVRAIASRNPGCASLVTRRTPESPRPTMLRRNRIQDSRSSPGLASTPRTWRSPSAVTPMATSTASDATRPSWRALTKVASSQTYG